MKITIPVPPCHKIFYTTDVGPGFLGEVVPSEAVLDLETGELRETFYFASTTRNAPEPVSLGDSVLESIALLTGLQKNAEQHGISDLRNEEGEEDTYHGWRPGTRMVADEKERRIVGRRILNPGDADYPTREEFAPNLMANYPQRVWTEISNRSASEERPLVGAGVVFMEEGEEIPRHMDQLSVESMPYLLIKEWELVNLGMAPDYLDEQFLSLDFKQTRKQVRPEEDGADSAAEYIVALLSDDAGNVYRRWITPLPEKPSPEAVMEIMRVALTKCS